MIGCVVYELDVFFVEGGCVVVVLMVWLVVGVVCVCLVGVSFFCVFCGLVFG